MLCYALPKESNEWRNFVVANFKRRIDEWSSHKRAIKTQLFWWKQNVWLHYVCHTHTQYIAIQNVENVLLYWIRMVGIIVEQITEIYINSGRCVYNPQKCLSNCYLRVYSLPHIDYHSLTRSPFLFHFNSDSRSVFFSVILYFHIDLLWFW